MHKDSKWAKQIIALQQEDGSWGNFHSLAQFSNKPITTEQALRRLERLGYTIEDTCIQKAVSYMHDCLIGKNTIPDAREQTHDWDIFTSRMLATWIRRFTLDNCDANKVAQQWADIISAALRSGTYYHEAYIVAYSERLGRKPSGGRLIDFVNFYTISLLHDCLDKQTECTLVDYVVNKIDGIYYIYDKSLKLLPQYFASKETSHYLGAMELLSEYKYAKEKLRFVVHWLDDNKNEAGKWDMGKTVNDKMYFPLSDDWRKKEVREADCTQRIKRLRNELLER